MFADLYHWFKSAKPYTNNSGLDKKLPNKLKIKLKKLIWRIHAESKDVETRKLLKKLALSIKHSEQAINVNGLLSQLAEM